MNKLCLFDIDKTLISCNNVHEAAFSAALKKVYGVDANINVIEHPGMTDKQIIIEVLKKSGLKEKRITEKLEECAKAMIDYFKENINDKEIFLYEGARELLETLSRNGVFLGLATGNLEDIARNKLTAAGINNYFKIGGFGSDGINRVNLVKAAIKKAEKYFNFRPNNNNVFLFGDTPRDMAAGKGAGVKTVGVASGIYTKTQLKKSGADFIIDNLKNTDEIFEMIFLKALD